jgi:hypothetical protein
MPPPRLAATPVSTACPTDPDSCDAEEATRRLASVVCRGTSTLNVANVIQPRCGGRTIRRPRSSRGPGLQAAQHGEQESDRDEAEGDETEEDPAPADLLRDDAGDQRSEQRRDHEGRPDRSLHPRYGLGAEHPSDDDIDRGDEQAVGKAEDNASHDQRARRQ